MDKKFLPVTREEMLERGWDQVDFVYVCGDAYVDHSSFGAAIITRGGTWIPDRYDRAAGLEG